MAQSEGLRRTRAALCERASDASALPARPALTYSWLYALPASSETEWRIWSIEDSNRMRTLYAQQLSAMCDSLGTAVTLLRLEAV